MALDTEAHEETSLRLMFKRAMLGIYQDRQELSSYRVKYEMRRRRMGRSELLRVSIRHFPLLLFKQNSIRLRR